MTVNIFVKSILLLSLFMLAGCQSNTKEKDFSLEEYGVQHKIATGNYVNKHRISEWQYNIAESNFTLNWKLLKYDSIGLSLPNNWTVSEVKKEPFLLNIEGDILDQPIQFVYSIRKPKSNEIAFLKDCEAFIADELWHEDSSAVRDDYAGSENGRISISRYKYRSKKGNQVTLYSCIRIKDNLMHDFRYYHISGTHEEINNLLMFELMTSITLNSSSIFPLSESLYLLDGTVKKIEIVET